MKILKTLLIILLISVVSLLAYGEDNGVSKKPLLGWSSWSVVRDYPTESKIIAQIDAVVAKLQSHGYQYINLDDYYYLNPNTTVDAYGRWAIDTNAFPSGMKALGDYIHSKGLKYGMYITPGIPKAAVDQNTPIEGTVYHARDIANTGRNEINYNTHYNSSTAMYYIDFTKPGSQEFINSWAKLFASYGVDFIKLDGVGSWDIPDVIAWSKALNQSGRQIHFELSNDLDFNYAGTWQQYANGWRTQGDIESYGSTTTDWGHVVSRFNSNPRWAKYVGPGNWYDFDSIDVANGTRDGINDVEKQTYVTLWSIAASHFYTGNDMTNTDSYGLGLLTNDEVIAVNQSGTVGVPLWEGGNTQVWRKKLPDGSFAVALFNLGDSATSVTAYFSDIGFFGTGFIRDLWSHSNLGSFNQSFSTTLNPHECKYIKLTPALPVTTYEAESPVNTLNGQAVLADAGFCVGGQKVGYIGNGGELQFNNIYVNKAGTYQMTICYVSEEARSAHVTVNNSNDQIVNFNGFTLSSVHSIDVSVNLNAGNNTIKFYNATGWSPDIDNINIRGYEFDLNSYYQLVNKLSGKQIAVKDSSLAKEAPLVQWASNLGYNQQWQMVNDGSGYINLISRNTGFYADIYKNLMTNGTQLIQWENNGGDNQKWNIINVGNGYYKIVNKSTWKLMDVSSRSIEDNAAIIQWEDNDGDNQKWSLTKVQ